MTPLLSVAGVSKRYGLPRAAPWSTPAFVQALRDVTLAVEPGRSLGVVGESGSGKSTLARLVLGLERPDGGTIRLADEAQAVFQDPYGSLDPRRTVGWTVTEPLWRHRIGRRERADIAMETLAQVGLGAGTADKYPHEFSGGQRQRIAIARALVTRPKLIVADEPVSALDVSVQAQVLNLLADLQRDHGVTLLFISHDLAVVEHVCPQAVVLYRGRIVERGAPEQLFTRSAHPYTEALVAAAPVLGGARPMLPAPERRSEVGRRAQAPACAYAPRCPRAQARCVAERPRLVEVAPGQEAACHFPGV